uniref:Uncharacterized protein n=1 Tax=Arundo donax TaxID=35708 RepID=A0A0A9U838_ARUDO
MLSKNNSEIMLRLCSFKFDWLNPVTACFASFSCC